MKTFVIYDNPMQALSRRYAVFRGGSVVDRMSTRASALRRAIFFCQQNLKERLGMDPAKWSQIVAGAKQDQEDIVQLKNELDQLKTKKGA